MEMSPSSLHCKSKGLDEWIRLIALCTVKSRSLDEWMCLIALCTVKSKGLDDGSVW